MSGIQMERVEVVRVEVGHMMVPIFEADGWYIPTQDAYEYGWAGDAQAQHWYATKEEAEEFMGDPKQFRRRRAGAWEPVTEGNGE